MKTSLTKLELHPENLRTEIEELERIIYENINNGVYQAGLLAQSAYELAVEKLFKTLDFLEDDFQMCLVRQSDC